MSGPQPPYDPSRRPAPATIADPNASAPARAYLHELPRTGDLIDNQYRVAKQLGAGAMGVVFRGVDERLRRDIAIKFVQPEWAALGEVRSAFLEEARALAAVRNDHVVEVFDFGEHKGLPFFVMAYYPGRTLRQWIDQRGSGGMAFDEAFGLIEQIARGVQAIHEAGLVHADLKPQNILTDENYRLAVADLGLAGLAKVRDAESSMLAGSFDYTAPELGGAPIAKELEPRRDVWATAAIAWELLVGRRLIRRRARGPQLHGLRPDLPEAICDAVELALHEDPAKRTPTVQHFRRELRAARPGQLAPDSVPADPPRVVAPSRSTGGRFGRIVLVDDDPEFVSQCTAQLELEFPGSTVVPLTNPRLALTAIGQGPCLLITDLDMPDLDGFDVVARARASNSELPIVVLTGNGNADHWRRLKQLGANACLLKPADRDTLGAVLRAQAQRANLSLER